MADKTIGQLNEITMPPSADVLFVCEQGGQARKMTAGDFNDWLSAKYEADGFITSITKDETYSGGLVDKYIITFSGASAKDAYFYVTNGDKITQITPMYAVSSSSTTPPSGESFNPNQPTLSATDKYLWSYTVFTFASGTTMNVPGSGSTPAPVIIGVYGDKGDTGDPATLESTELDYATSSTLTVPSSDEWSSTFPSTLDPGKYLWTRTTLKFNAGSAVTYTVSWQGRNGEGSAGDATPLVDVTGGGSGTSGSFSRMDHQHPLNVTTGAPPADSSGGAAGTAGYYARSDHSHELNVDQTNPAALGSASPGTATTYARRDHVHPYASRVSSVSLTTSWTQGDGYYTQAVTMTGETITNNTKIDLQASAAVYSALLADGVSALYIVNDMGALTAYAMGAAPTSALTVQCLLTEVG